MIRSPRFRFAVRTAQTPGRRAPMSCGGLALALWFGVLCGRGAIVAQDTPKAPDVPVTPETPREGSDRESTPPDPAARKPRPGIRGVDRRVDKEQRTEDIVRLKDLSTVSGRLVELGDNSVRIEFRGGSKRVLKRDIEEVAFFTERRAEKPLDTDLVILKDTGHEVRGTVRESAGVVEVQLENGARAVYDRSRVARVVRRDEARTESVKCYTVELAAEIDAALAALGKFKDPEAVRSHSDFLIDAGILAIGKVVEARGKVTDAASTEALALDRVLRAYRLRELVTDSMEQDEPDIYAELLDGEEATRESLLKVLFPRFSDDCVDLAIFLIEDPREGTRVRAVAVELLRRLSRNRELVDLFNQNVKRDPEISFVAAVALARNRIFFGLPVLIDALELGGERNRDLREIADQVLRQTTRQDFGFRSQGTPDARALAVARWRDWWSQAEGDLMRDSYVVLQERAVVTEERRIAISLWKDAHRLLSEGRNPRAESLLREAVAQDPAYAKALLSLAILLYTDPGAPELPDDATEEARAERERLRIARISEAETTLVGMTDQVISDLETEDRYRIRFALGNVYLLHGRSRDAIEQYETAFALNPLSFRAVRGAADAHWELATGRNEITRGERRIEGHAALVAYQRALDIVRETLRNIRVLGIDDLPDLEQLPFERREHNRNVLSLRQELERESVRLFTKIAGAQMLAGDRPAAVKSLREALDTLETSFELENAKALEVELRTLLGRTFEANGERELAASEYARILKSLDPENSVARRGLVRLERR